MKRTFLLSGLILMGWFLLPASLQAARRHDPFNRSLARLKVSVFNYMPTRPYQANPTNQRGGQAIAVSENELLCVASQVRDAQLIQVKTAFQNNWIEAQVKVVDYDVNLALLEVPRAELKQPLQPIQFKKDIQLDSPVQYYWLTFDGRILNAGGSIEFPDVTFYPVTRSGFLYYKVTREASRSSYSEVVCQKKKAIGLVVSTSAESSISTVLTAEIIQAFLKRARSGNYTGMPKAGFEFQSLQDLHSREYLQLPEKESRGIWISKVYDFGTGTGILLPGDVLLRIGDYDIDPEGYVEHSLYGKLLFWHLIGHGMTDDVMPVEIVREGQYVSLDMPLTTFQPSDLPIPYHQIDLEPEFFIYGGLVFTEMTVDYLHAFGSGWKGMIDPLLVQDLVEYRFNKFPDRERTVVLSHVLKHSLNRGYQDMNNHRLLTLNGTPVRDLAHAWSLVQKLPESEYAVFTFDGFERDIILPVKQCQQADLEMQETYNLPSLHRFRSKTDLDSPAD